MLKNIYVTEAGYDNIGAILDKLGSGYPYSTIEWEMGVSNLGANDVIFINCSSQCSGFSPLWQNEFRTFIQRGGSAYVSDWGGHFLQSSFPEYVSFTFDGETGIVKSEVIDSGLKELLGNSIDLNFDMPGWWRIASLSNNVQAHLQGKILGKPTPLLVSFKHGSGYVIYTSFHNHAQTTDLEERLLEFLVLRPIMSSVAELAQATVEAQSYDKESEIFSTIDPSKKTIYEVDVPSPTTIMAVLSWEGNAEFRMELKSPSGQIVQELEQNNAPVIIEYFAQETGKWVIKLDPKDVPFINFPIVLTFGKGGIQNNKSAQASTPASAVTTQTKVTNDEEEIKSPIVGMKPITTITDSTGTSSPVSGLKPIDIQTPSASKLKAPSIMPIKNLTGENSYQIQWMGVHGANKFKLIEDTTPDFKNSKSVFEGNGIQFIVKNQSPGTYFYKVCALSDLGEGDWSEVISTKVLNK